jgi:hypothetical protein
MTLESMEAVSSELSACDSDFLRKLLEERDLKEKAPFESLIYTSNNEIE